MATVLAPSPVLSPLRMEGWELVSQDSDERRFLFCLHGINVRTRCLEEGPATQVSSLSDR